MSKSLAQRTRQRMEYLRNLIEHPRTGEGERAAAAGMLDKLLKKLDSVDLNPAGKTYVRTFAGFEGNRYQAHSHLSVKEIAALIRNEIKLIRKAGQATKKAGAPQPGELSVPDPIGELPPDVKISVRVRHGSSIDITVKGLAPEWFTVEWHNEFHRNLMTRGPRLEAVFIALGEIHASYNYDNSDTQSDYFERNYWGGVEVDFYDRMAAEKFHQVL